MVEVELTWGRAAKVWWSLVWRSVLLGLLAGVVIGFVVGLIGAMLRIDKAAISSLCAAGGALAGIPVGLWVVKRVLQKRFGDFRIALITDTGSANSGGDTSVDMEFSIS